MLKEALDKIEFYHALKNTCPLHKASEREYWDSLDSKLKEKYIREAEGFLAFDYPSLLATRYMEYMKTGNRSNFEEIYFQRRMVVTFLVIGECIEHKGRFLDDIINGIWLICEETSWVLPAHNQDKMLNCKEQSPMDLFAAETGGILSFAYFLLQEELNQVSQLITDRMKTEVKSRILAPYRENDFWWMSFSDKKPMNWNPWCNANCLASFLIMEEDRTLQQEGIEKIVRSLDLFIESYGFDGGCDEGISYWERAGGCLFEAIELLSSVSRKVDSIFLNEKLKNIFSFPYKVNIEKDHYLNFADASSKNAISVSLLHRIGDKSKENGITAFSKYLYNISKSSAFKRNDLSGINLYRQVMELFVFNGLLHEEQEAIERLKDVYFKGIEVMIARENSSSEGLYLAAKGGDNFENHNHNDVGSFIIYKDGAPVFIDVGVEVYTKKTFSDERYDIWTMQSQYHNLPTMVGQMQKDGLIYKAKEVQYNCTDDLVRFSMNLQNAYGGENIENLTRHFYFYRKGRAYIEIIDDYEVKLHDKNTVYYFMTSRKPNLIEDGEIQISGINLFYDKQQFNFTFEEIEISDGRLMPVWGVIIYRMVFTLMQKKLKGRVIFKIQSCLSPAV